LGSLGGGGGGNGDGWARFDLTRGRRRQRGNKATGAPDRGSGCSGGGTRDGRGPGSGFDGRRSGEPAARPCGVGDWGSGELTRVCVTEILDRLAIKVHALSIYISRFPLQTRILMFIPRIVNL
jgi:hypothetical protein